MPMVQREVVVAFASVAHSSKEHFVMAFVPHIQAVRCVVAAVGGPPLRNDKDEKNDVFLVDSDEYSVFEHFAPEEIDDSAHWSCWLGRFFGILGLVSVKTFRL
ncbi:hypothetical protein DM860_006816 [Cuscuta australis]|uniref:Uncharacterized protein n=1 Tax=Cuscuta australis TaxID=267555 RepID=A0A328E564_9ASTE|nr:hypothetical protein DM860_006816 [Cuscuta australis]